MWRVIDGSKTKHITGHGPQTTKRIKEREMEGINVWVWPRTREEAIVSS